MLREIRIKVVDGDGDTVQKFSKRSYFDKRMQHERTEPWAAEAKPVSIKWLHSDRNPGGFSHPSRLAQPKVSHHAGQKYLDLPGLTLKWQKVEPVLDKIAFALGLVDDSGVVLKDDMAAATVTVEQLRKFA